MKGKNINSVDNCLAADNILTINSGNLTLVSTSGDCIKSAPDEITDTTLGQVVINGGTINAEAKANDGIQALSSVTINGGNITVKTNGGSSTKVASTDEGSYKGIKGDEAVYINGGTITVNSADDSVHSNGNVVIAGGTLTLATGDDGVHADSLVNIKDGTITVTTCYEGIEGTDITIDGGTISVTATDDGINISGGNDASGMSHGFGGMGTDSTSGTAGTLTINNGVIYVDAAGDGLDSNGSIVMNGGTVIVNGPTNNGNGAIDYDKSFTMNGGTLLAAGASGMAQSVSAGTQAAVSFNANLKAGTTIAVKDSSGNVIAAYKLVKNCGNIVFSSSETTSGKSFTLVSGGTVSGTETAGLYTGEVTFTGGTTSATATASTVSNNQPGGGGNTPGGNRPGGNQPGGSDTQQSGISGFFAKIIAFFNKIFTFIKSMFGAA